MRQQIRKPKRGKAAKELLTDEQVDLVNEWLEGDSLLSMNTLVERLKDRCGVTVSKSYISKIIDDFTYSLARLTVNPLAPIKQNSHLLQERQRYAQRLMSLHKDHTEEQFVFVHFADFTLVTRTNAPGEQNQRGTKRSLYNSVRLALNKNQVLLYNFDFLAMESDDYLQFFTDLMKALLKNGLEKAVIVFDPQYLPNGVEKEIQQKILDTGHQFLHLPAHSLFLNPVERILSSWKGITKRANPKDEKSLVNCLKQADEKLITQNDCNHCFTFSMSSMIHCYHMKPYDLTATTMSFVSIKD